MNVETPQTPNTATGTGGGVPEIQPSDQIPATKRKLTDVGARIMSGPLAKDLKRNRKRPPQGHSGPKYSAN
jgi:hypothetical protein